jgi:hypothetical protein
MKLGHCRHGNHDKLRDLSFWKPTDVPGSITDSNLNQCSYDLGNLANETWTLPDKTFYNTYYIRLILISIQTLARDDHCKPLLIRISVEASFRSLTALIEGTGGWRHPPQNITDDERSVDSLCAIPSTSTIRLNLPRTKSHEFEISQPDSATLQGLRKHSRIRIDHASRRPVPEPNEDGRIIGCPLGSNQPLPLIRRLIRVPGPVGGSFSIPCQFQSSRQQKQN